MMDLKLKDILNMTQMEKQDYFDQLLYKKPELSSIFLRHDTKLLPTFIHRQSGLEFSYIPGGDFEMGFSQKEELVAKHICEPEPIQANIDEMRPVTNVKVQSFLISRYPILNCIANQFLCSYNQELGNDKLLYSPAYLSREQAEELAEKLGCRLPYEKEWEYACRSETQTLFVFGDRLPGEKELERWLSLDFSDTKKLAANSFGLYGMFVGEWCMDKYRLSYDEFAQTEDGSYVIRGGGSLFWPWQDQEWVWCMSAMRMPSKDLIDGTCGLRLVFDLNF
jgi:formylglycine-generating enzyme required for sulfatase activity